MKKTLHWILPLVAVMFLAGCGGSGSISENKPIEEVMAEAKTMAVDQLKSTIEKYENVIASKKEKIVALQEKLKAIPMTQMLGEEAKALKADVSEVTTSIKALTERMNVYIQQLKIQGDSL